MQITNINRLNCNFSTQNKNSCPIHKSNSITPENVKQTSFHGAMERAAFIGTVESFKNGISGKAYPFVVKTESSEIFALFKDAFNRYRDIVMQSGAKLTEDIDGKFSFQDPNGNLIGVTNTGKDILYVDLARKNKWTAVVYQLSNDGEYVQRTDSGNSMITEDSTLFPIEITETVHDAIKRFLAPKKIS